jgi:hypothetical protein
MNKIFSKDKDLVLLIGYVALIYSTLQFMPKVNSFFSSLLGRYFGLVSNMALVTVILIVFVLIFNRKPTIKNPILFYAAMALIFASYLALLLFALPIVAEKMHLLEYGFLSYLALRAVQGAQGKIGTVPEASKGPLWGLSHFSSKQSLYVVLIVIIVGSLDELIQGFTPGRYCELRDVILNIVSGILGLFVLKLLKPEHYSYD